jgi:triosephosphate isomerase
MLRRLGKNIKFVIVGHSERRRFLGETDLMVNKKIQAALAAGLRVILCVGEPAEIRKQGTAATQRYIKNQLKEDLHNLHSRLRGNDGIIVAYEPIWAIGTGRHCPPEEAVAMARLIKREIANVSVLYGGSVDGGTAASYLCYNEINGVLVGGASLRIQEIKKIIEDNKKDHG